MPLSPRAAAAAEAWFRRCHGRDPAMLPARQSQRMERRTSWYSALTTGRQSDLLRVRFSRGASRSAKQILKVYADHPGTLPFAAGGETNFSPQYFRRHGADWREPARCSASLRMARINLTDRSLSKGFQSNCVQRTRRRSGDVR